MKKILKIGGAFLLFFALIYLAGPKPAKSNLNPELKELKVSIDKIEAYVQNHEAGIEGIKKRNEARIVWADSPGVKTPISVIYLHGFSASEQEGDPVHKEFAKRYSCNLYLPRLQSHGLVQEKAMRGLTVENYLESAKKAINIGKVIGDSVIIMSTSTGGTFALYLAAYNPEIKGLICYSPNIRVNNPSAPLLNNPWGKQIAKAVIGGDSYNWEGNDSIKAYWSTTYPIDALITMQDLLENTMTDETFKMVKQPVFMGYYYKNEKEQDQVVSVKEALKMFSALGTPQDQKVKIPFPLAGHHVIASRHQSGDLKSVQKETYKFAEEVLGLKPVNEY